jgi:arginyl-tRNA synthetase
MITADLDAELTRSLRALTGRGVLPGAVLIPTGGSWRPGADPASYASSAPFELARLTRSAPGEVAAALAAELRDTPWIERAEPSGAGYLTLTVTADVLAGVARRIVAAGPGCARSSILHGTCVQRWPWPDPAAAASWEQAWREQADAMVGQLAIAAGASGRTDFAGERAVHQGPAFRSLDSSVAAAVGYHGLDVVRYSLARTRPSSRGSRVEPAPLASVQLAHATASSTLRWAADLGTTCHDPRHQLAAALASQPEREVLGELSWLPVRVASAARRCRPGEVPRYLERLALRWVACQQESPALPFGGVAAARDAATVNGRLMLAAAVAIALSAGLALIGVAASDQI